VNETKNENFTKSSVWNIKEYSGIFKTCVKKIEGTDTVIMCDCELLEILSYLS
jgi:hypothetical protein